VLGNFTQTVSLLILEALKLYHDW